MLDPESDEGNIEYKRYLINLNEIRLKELATQMKYRIAEGNGLAIYYLGIEDDGSPYLLTDEQRMETLDNFKKIVKLINCKIYEIQFIDKKYFKATVILKQKLYLQIRVCLVGASLTGKTTFLANILLNRVDSKENPARTYLLNHKHEIESGITSSISINSMIYNNISYLFLDTPGDKSFIRTKWRIILSSKPNIILNFDKKVDKLVEEYCTINKVPIIDIDINKYNCCQLINKNEFFNNLLKFNNKTKPNKSLFNKFIVLKMNKKNLESGYIVSGFLEYGLLQVGQKLNWYVNENKFECYVKEIYVNNSYVKKINGPYFVSMNIYLLTDAKIRYGLISNQERQKVNLQRKETGYCDNKMVDNNNYYNIDDKIIVIDNESNKKIIFS